MKNKIEIVELHANNGAQEDPKKDLLHLWFAILVVVHTRFVCSSAGSSSLVC